MIGEVEKIYSDTEEVVFHTSCGCMCKEHDILVTCKKEHDTHILEFNTTLQWPAYLETETDLNEYIYTILLYYKRIKHALKLIFTGKLDVESSIIFRNDAHIKGFVQAINESFIMLDTREK